MLTCPRKYVKAGRKWLEYFEKNDIHKWIIALEHGKNGLEHWQIRFKARGVDTKEGKKNFFNAFKTRFPECHLEFTENWCEYERKEGFFVCDSDNRDTLSIRFGTPNIYQRQIVQELRSQGNRSIDVYYDPKGSHGKTWISLHLFEKGKALIIPRYCNTARGISNYVCSQYNGQDIIILDIPRSRKLSDDIYECIEEIKDGLVFDERYSGKSRNIRGCKLVVFTNNKLDYKKLSKDRWRLHGMKSVPQLEESRRAHP